MSESDKAFEEMWSNGIARVTSRGEARAIWNSAWAKREAEIDGLKALINIWQEAAKGLVERYGINLQYEDQLPANMTDAEYDGWFKQSAVVDGVRMGPKVK